MGSGAEAMTSLPKPPPGFVLDQPPAPPPGFELDAPLAPPGPDQRTYADLDRAIAGIDPVDVAKATGSGLVTGTEGLVGLPGDARDWAAELGDHIANAVKGRNLSSLIVGDQPAKPPSDDYRTNVLERLQQPSALPGPLGFALKMWPSSREIQGAVKKSIGFTPYQAKTLLGKYAGTVASFVPSALGGPGGLAGKFFKYAFLPGVASEAAGEMTQGTAAEPWARTGAALATGGLAAALSRPSTAGLALREHLPPNMTSADVDMATALVKKGADQGVAVTLPEALAQVTKGRVDITDLQRWVESSRGGRPTMNAFMAERPDQARAAMGGVADMILPPGAMKDPIKAGLDIQRASRKTLDAIRKGINDETNAAYEAAGTQIVDEATFAELNKDPLVKSALKAVRDDPVHSRFIEGMPNQSVAVLNEVKKYLDDLAGAADRDGKNAAASQYGGVARDVRDVAKGASSDYADALERQATLREALLAPAEAGPLGKMAGTEDIQAQGRAMLPKNPPEGSDIVAARETGRLAETDPALAGQLVRTHVTTLFNKAAKAGDQWGPGKAAIELRGNTAEAKSLEAAVRALPDGDAKWQGLSDFLDILEATGKRQRPNSATQANMMIADTMERGSPAGVAASQAVSPGSIFTYVNDAYRKFRLGKNAEAVARLITSPDAGPIFKDLAAAKTSSDRMRAAAQLSYFFVKEGSDSVANGREEKRK